MSKIHTSGVMLTVTDIDTVATRIEEMWRNYNTERRAALALGEEARRFVFATDLDSTSAYILPHKNRTHQPKLTSISDTLQTQYYEASLSSPEFFRFEGATPEDRAKARKIEAWLRVKLEAKKFRETVGRQLLADFTNYGNCFASVEYVREFDDQRRLVYQGPVFKRISPLDIVFNPRAPSFKESPKLVRRLVHIADIVEFPDKYPTAGFDVSAIQKVKDARRESVNEDWVEVLKERGLAVDGYSSWDEYFKQDLVELIIYFGDVFDPDTGTVQRNRVVYVADRTFVIRNAPNNAPKGFDTLHHGGWRVRNDNLWCQGPLDNLVGMQYRIDHLENLKADIFDLIAHPVIIMIGEVDEPESGYAPGAVYYGEPESKVEMLAPNTQALQADTQIEIYHRKMEEFAGAPPESRGIRTPGEKTAFEVSKLDANATMMFVDKARNFELMLEGLLKEAFELMMINFDETDYVQIFNDVLGVEELKELAYEDVAARGEFRAVGARHWLLRNRKALELQQLQQTIVQAPQLAAHISGIELARTLERTLNIEDDKIVKEYEGIREQVTAQAIAQSMLQSLSEETGQQLGAEDDGTQPVQPGPGTPEDDTWAA